MTMWMGGRLTYLPLRGVKEEVVVGEGGNVGVVALSLLIPPLGLRTTTTVAMPSPSKTPR
jgi:hypothetical protein